MIFTNSDRDFLRALKIAADPVPDTQITPLLDEEDDSTCNAPSAGWCGEPSHTTLDGIPVDETVRMLQECEIPVTAENWMRLNFAGRPPAIGHVDGEILCDLPAWVRKVYDPDFELDEEEES